MFIVSACLVGLPCRYNGKAAFCREAAELMQKGMAIPVCPEQLGGLATPRAPCELVVGDGDAALDGRARVLGKDGCDHTQAFVRGAGHVLELCKTYSIKNALLCQRSPSCGAGRIYDGTFSGELINGDGVLTALLKRNGIDVKAGGVSDGGETNEVK